MEESEKLDYHRYPRGPVRLRYRAPGIQPYLTEKVWIFMGEEERAGGESRGGKASSRGEAFRRTETAEGLLGSR